PVGSCVGQRGSRVDRVVNELKGEKIDIIKWSEDPAEFIANALNPANVRAVYTEASGARSCIVVVPDNQLSLAIGKEGQNARLAAKLTGWKIDIKSQTQYMEQMADMEIVEEEATAMDQFETFGGEAFTGIDLPVDEDDTL
ncbi:MAG: transcription termination/antitermination protein NusA, partial [Clostridia bacterium]|nr:transcription termination/antitermination protein NusA [Clostridia bacterium]